MEKMEWAEAVDALGAQYGVLDDVITSLDSEELLAPSGCRGWTNDALIFHMLLDAQRALVTFSSPVAGPADTNFVDYWRGFVASDEDSRAHAIFVRMSAAAHPDETTTAGRWHLTAPAALRRAGETSGIDFVTTQGYTLTTADFIATLVVEAAVHHLDLVVNLRHKPGPAEPAVSITTRTLDGLLGQSRPEQWDEITYLLKATGRVALDERDRVALGEVSAAFPVFS